MKWLSLLYSETMLQSRYYLRNRDAFFFTFGYPSFIFILFGLIWGKQPNYLNVLFTGIIGMTVTSDALLGIGPVVKAYRDTGILKLLKVLPYSFFIHFTGIFLSRFFVSILSLLLLSIIGKFIFGMQYTFVSFCIYIIGIMLGTLLFGFLGLWVTMALRGEGGRGVLNFIFYPMLFFSGCFYPLEILPKFVLKIVYILPLTQLNLFMRGHYICAYALIFWIILFSYLSFYTFKLKEVRR